MKYHVHIYKIVAMAEVEIEAENPKESKQKAFEIKDTLEYKQSDCNYIALSFDADDIKGQEAVKEIMEKDGPVVLLNRR